MIVFYDRFAQEFTTERDNFAPPERYYEIICNRDSGDRKLNLNVEKWITKSGKYVYISYSDDDIISGKINTLRKEIEDINNDKLSYMISYKIPEKKYNELIKYMNRE